MLTLNAIGQSFKDPIVNPFGFEPLRYVGNDHFTSFSDLDNDGDQDLLVSDFDGVFHYYENIGDSLIPFFAQSKPNPFNISVIDYPNCACNTLFHNFVDIDNDGDQDLIALSWWASIYFYAENIGDKSNPNFKAFEKDLEWMPANFKKESFVGIDFVDIDNDGDLDFFSCEEEIFSFRENKGTASKPNFSGTLITNAFGVSISGRYLFPSLTDIDNDGDFDLFIGGNDSDLNDFQFYENIGTKASPNFTKSSQNPFDLTNSNIKTPALKFVDLDGDGDEDIFTGGVLDDSNDFQYYENKQITNSNKRPSKNDNQIKVFPNPVTKTLFIETSKAIEIESLELVNTLGELVLTLNFNAKSIDVSDVNPGQYFLRTKNGIIINTVPVIIGITK